MLYSVTVITTIGLPLHFSLVYETSLCGRPNVALRVLFVRLFVRLPSNDS